MLRQPGPHIYSVFTNRAGSTSTTWALGMAAGLAAKGKSVTLIDADMEGGTIRASLGLHKGRDASIANLMNTNMDVDILMRQTVGVEGYENVRVIPGFADGNYGPELTRPLLTMEPALRQLPDDYVIIDCGHPLSHAAIGSPQDVFNAIGLVSEKLFFVARDDPGYAQHAIGMFRHLHIDSGRWGEFNLVICEQRKGRERDHIRQRFAQALQVTPLAGWAWNERQAIKSLNQNRAYPMGDLPKRCGLLVD